jgi:hypothetical protein
MLRELKLGHRNQRLRVSVAIHPAWITISFETFNR